MTAAISRGTASLAVPQTQNSAPVHSFRCLFTHDVRRKQKRWHDGVLKFHTFNKRVMVYDDTSNFIGDTHYKGGGELQAGDEVRLDEGVLVEIGDRLGTSQTNLAPLFDRERKQLEEPAARFLSPAQRQMNGSANGTSLAQRKHKPLNALLGAPRGSHGRATVPQSPYDARHGGTENEWQAGSDTKRRKTGEMTSQAHPWNVERVTKADEGTTSKDTLLWAKITDARKMGSGKSTNKTQSGDQRSPVVKEVVDITSDNEGVMRGHEQVAMSDVTLPDTPPPRPRTSNTTRAEIILAGKKRPAARAPPAGALPPSSPPVSARNRVKNIQDQLEEQLVREDSSSPMQPKPVYKALRLAKSQPKKMLFCQPVQKPVQKVAQATSRNTLRDPFELSDAEDYVVTKVVAKSRRKKKSSQAPPAESRRSIDAIPGRATLNTNDSREARSSSPAFGTILRPEELFEAPSLSYDTIPTTHSPPITSKPTNQKQISHMQNYKLSTAHGMMDQRLLSLCAESTNSNTVVAKTTANQRASRFALDRNFRRVQSENDVPMPVTYAIDLGSLPAVQEEQIAPGKATKLGIKKRNTAPKQPVQRSASLSIPTAMHKAKTPVKPASTIRSQEIGAWTIEATDLFDWRPPNWDAREKRKKAAARADTKENSGK